MKKLCTHILLFFVVTLWTSSIVFAQNTSSNPIIDFDIEINQSQEPVISGTVEGSNDGFINFYLYSSEKESSLITTAAGDIPWSPSSFSFPLESYLLTDSKKALFTVLDIDTEYDEIHVTSTQNSTGNESPILQIFTVEDFFENSNGVQDTSRSANVNDYIESISVDTDSVNISLRGGLEDVDVAILLQNSVTGSTFDISAGGIQGNASPVSSVIELAENEYTVNQDGTITKVIPGGDINFDIIAAQAVVPNEVLPEVSDIIDLSPTFLIANILEELPPSVAITDLTWEHKDLITQSNGTFAYHIKSQSNVAKDVGDPVYLVLQKTSPAGETTYQFLGTYEPQLFKVCHPTPIVADINGDCDVDNLSVVDWSIVPGYTYSLYFSDRVNNPRAISTVTTLETPVTTDPTNPNDIDPADDGPGGTDPTAPGGSGSIYTSEQQAALESGIVSTECGYNLKSISDACSFDDFMKLLNNIINWIIILILPIAVIVLAYTGFLYLTSGGNKTKRDKAKKAMTSLLTGIVVVLGAWLLVRTVVSTLGYDTSSENETYYLEQI